MREYLDGILSFIGAESLTDEEFGTVEVTDQNDHVAVYDTLLGILQSRDLVSDMTSRLLSYFQAMGVAATPPNNSYSNIFIGADLGC
jgi:hypothetical protein